MHSSRNNDGDRWGGLGGCKRFSFSYTARFYVHIQLCFRGERWVAFGANDFNPNKVNKDLIETLVRICQFFFLRLKYNMKALWLLLRNIIVNLIYPFFFSSLIAAVKLVWLVSLPQRVLVRCGLQSSCSVSRIEPRWLVRSGAPCRG